MFCFFFSNFFKVYLFILRESMHTSQERAERRRDGIPNRLCTISTEPNMGLELTNSEIMTWAEIKSWMCNQLGHLGAPSSFFQFGCLLFIFLIQLQWWGLPVLYWIKVVRVDILLLFLILEEKLSGFELSYMAFIILRHVPSSPTLLRIFIINGCWILLNAFLHLLW